MPVDRSAHRNAFATYHPLIVFAFFVGAVVLCVLVNDPLVELAAFACAAAYYLCVAGRAGLKTIALLLPLGVAVAAANPLLNPRGETVLFTWLAGRPYTLEALVYGASMSLMFLSVLLWFFAYNKVMTSDRFTYLFGRLAPALTLIFTMVLRLVPTYQRKAQEIATARACVGHSLATGGILQRARSGTVILSALVSWALEGSIDTADSMRSRGFGTGRRTFFAKYAFTARDCVLLAAMTVLFAAALAGVLAGAGTMEFFPHLAFSAPDILDALAIAAFALFLILPTVVCAGEAILWSISLSRT